MSLPTSLRTDRGERYYQRAKKAGLTRPLEEEKVLLNFKYWKVIENRFPYDSCFQTHHMLIPKRKFSRRFQMTDDELDELDFFIDTYAEEHYDIVFENMMKRRSIAGLFHLHLAKYYDTREEFYASHK